MIIFNGDHAEFELNHANTPLRERPDWPFPSFDATDWSEEFCRIARSLGHDIDQAWMTGWFANALMRGYDEGIKAANSPRQIEEAEQSEADERYPRANRQPDT